MTRIDAARSPPPGGHEVRCASSSAPASTASTAAWDAAQRGLSVALIDKGDFGGGTSFNNLKTLHGGLRSLQALNFAQMRLFIRERRALARIAAAPGAAAAVRGADRRAIRSAARWRCGSRWRSTTPWRAIATRASPIRALHLPASRDRVARRGLRLNPVDRARGRHRRRGLVRLPDAQHRSRDAVVPAVRGRCAARRPPTTSQAQRASCSENGRVIGVQRRRSADQRSLRRFAARWS